MAADEIHWGEVTIDWDGGEEYTLHVPHAMYDWPARWFAQNLHIPLRAVLRDPRVRVTESNRTESAVDWGDISIGPIALPLRNDDSADRLRQIIEDAADRADEAAEQAIEHWAALSKALRRA